MSDREKVIKALEICEKKDCALCPYTDWCGEYDDSYCDCTKLLAKDALALIKEQEVIRCKDCKFWYKDECSHLCAINGDLRPSGWYCADGERKTACDGCENKGSEDCALGKPGSENAYCPNGKLR